MSPNWLKDSGRITSPAVVHLSASKHIVRVKATVVDSLLITAFQLIVDYNLCISYFGDILAKIFDSFSATIVDAIARGFC